ncbi:class II fumarate hydratase [Kytococcus sedentarius]|uniref:Fumarate hydratase class II n=1 Tax=Kytococcus sedentarius (strain ATCC 14392 / DSM 20547 / JCM 11482 / CCUG 33030 / NBRC 15357 / NCTC 11040 / CCM 314 / 541) TaxID=478801 RepID=C7NEW8_KYTSD|nr:class II fumarate hydratase [Kytococcus sedentarius]ACV05792.1 fumarase [Kytococcus sedentarius DSM 20547]QQB64198.1 class II fumarate hydratase [Kytococcus sedentarius]STX12794.1 Fumarate hydratase class II [Kytococcus sedentarius]
MTEYRTEHDSMGEMQVPAEALYGASTARAVENFPISGRPVPGAVIHAFGQLKAAAARANAELGNLDQAKADAIVAAAEAVARGEHDEHFPVDIFQTGSGTSTNMNSNEVIATLARQAGTDVHPNDDVNMGQSSNDTFPTAMRVAMVQGVAERLEPALKTLQKALEAKATEFAEVVKAGRTHLMDAVPVTLGQEFGGYARQIELGRERLAQAAQAVAELPLGGTAAGTGLNAHPEFAGKAIADLSRQVGVDMREAADHFEAQSTQDAVVHLSAATRLLAVSLTKICNDLRWMGSGPRAGLGELRLPELQPGSSIMPGKVNPVVPEATLMVCARVIGNDATIAFGGASGSFELNVMLPVMATDMLDSIDLLAGASRVLADRCVSGLEANTEQLAEYAGASTAIVTALNSAIGYEAASKVAKQSLAEKKTVRQVVIDRGHVENGDLTEEQLDQALDLLGMATPHGR